MFSCVSQCSPTVEAKLEPPSPPPRDAGIQLRCDRDFTDGEAMFQEHLMSSEGDISGNEDVDLEPPWYISGEYRKVCVGGDTENIYVRHDQEVWCGWKGAEWMNCPGERPNTWHKNTSSEQSETTLYAKERQLVMNPNEQRKNCKRRSCG